MLRFYNYNGIWWYSWLRFNTRGVLGKALSVSFKTEITVYTKKYAHGFCFAVLCCGYTLTDFPISIRLTSLALWQSNDCPSASKATLMNMNKYFMWIHYERLHNHNKAKHNKTVCIFLGIYCSSTGIAIGTWISNYIYIKHGDVITHPCNFNIGLVEPLLKLGHGCVIASHPRQQCRLVQRWYCRPDVGPTLAQPSLLSGMWNNWFIIYPYPEVISVSKKASTGMNGA